ncbi:probably inactive leucine-rich repeat receptor-like protein kinase At5g48380 [Salvia hispanica]|uniref:probably inactive leucine-rich repeat receptor-like protein kinase At5g48380 n=1 Tax=Salvia hispanica TaxID=49212 RepID=UPI00200923E7|nr:probably inactive leucine-rich repeat receptor-like protein kinase At5g48380 [Salvia hispanica]
MIEITNINSISMPIGVFANGLLVGWCLSLALFMLLRWFRPHSIITHLFKINTKPIPQLLPLQDPMISRLEKLTTRMSLLEVRQATGNLSQSNVIATAEMGITYKAALTNGWPLAVKRFGSTLEAEHEFLTEITTIGRLRHHNLVPLMGFCQESKDRFLIYNLMPNGRLHDRLFSTSKAREEWSVAKVAVGIARGIAWLHAHGVVHRGITSKCIMLDEDFNPRISDFGKATLLNPTSSSWEVSISSCRDRSVGLGCYQEDVHGFGKVLLELMTRRRYDEIVKLFDMDGDMLDQISVLINGDGVISDEMCCLMRVAAKCLECDPSSWPSMEEVCTMLTTKLHTQIAIESY